jgi:hypothetical protein
MKRVAGVVALLWIVLAGASAQAALTAADMQRRQTTEAALSSVDRTNVESLPTRLQSAGVLKCTGSRIQGVAEATAGEYGIFGASAMHVWIVMMSGAYTGMSAAMCFLAN